MPITSSFHFPAGPGEGPLPFCDPDAGIAFGKGGMRGVFQAGVVHGFVISGYFPQALSGTSVGCLAATALALAAELKTQRDRLELVGDLVAGWLRNPAEQITRALLRQSSGPARLVSDLLATELRFETLVRLGRVLVLFGEVGRGTAGERLRTLFSLLREIPGLAAELLGGLWRAPQELRGALRAGLRELCRADEPEGPLPRFERLLAAAQAVLTAYGMERGLLTRSPLDPRVERMLCKYGRRLGVRRPLELADLRAHLVFQVGNLSRLAPGSGRTYIERLARCEHRGGEGGSGCALPDWSHARLAQAIRAAWAIGPLFPGVLARELLGGEAAPAGRDPRDLLMDAAVLEKNPVAPIVDHWARRPRRGQERLRPHRLFTVYLSPIGEVSQPPGSPFFAPALHSLHLRDSLDQQLAARVTRLITGMIETLRDSGQPIPPRLNDGEYAPIYPIAIAPDELLPIESIGVPDAGELGAACAAGCRSTLETLHAETLAELGREAATVPCERLLARLRERHENPEPADVPFFTPVERLCGSCTKQLRAPAPVAARTEEQARAEAARARANHFAPFCHAAPPPQGFTAVVPAGGVFFGVFQVGAIAAFSDWGIRPDLYAGASVGTIFSYVMQACQEDLLRRNRPDRPASQQLAEAAPDGTPSVFSRVIRLFTTLPGWVDAAGEGADGPGVVDAVLTALAQRWSSPEVRPLRELTPRQVFLALRDAELGAAERPHWEALQAGLDALLFRPIPGRRSLRPRQLPPAYRLPLADRAVLRRFFTDLLRLRLRDALPGGEAASVLDRIAANLDFFDPAPPDHAAPEGEILGFRPIGSALREVVFAGADPKLDEHSAKQQVRFLFTVTHHTRGRLEHFGYADSRGAGTESPLALEACLAASSFPLAFRRRSQQEVFGLPEDDGTRYADGGIFNNFPSDSAFAYLRDLTDQPGLVWLGEVPLRFVLLSLTAPAPGSASRRTSAHRGALFALLQSLRRGEDEKVEKTMAMQRHINQVAAAANPILRELGRRQAIRAEMILVSPTYSIYGHSFAFKDYLGFRREKQEEMIASGCRRTRIALAFHAYQDRADAGSAPPPERPPDEDRVRAAFYEALRDEVRSVREHHASLSTTDCVLGSFGAPPPRKGEAPRPCRCPFALAPEEELQAVGRTCHATIEREIDVPLVDFKLYTRLRPS